MADLSVPAFDFNSFAEGLDQFNISRGQ